MDRRFFPSRRIADETVARFTDRVRQETDPATVRDELIAVVHETLDPEHAAVWTAGTRGALMAAVRSASVTLGVARAAFVAHLWRRRRGLRLRLGPIWSEASAVGARPEYSFAQANTTCRRPRPRPSKTSG